MKTMTYAARLVWNIHNWQYPSGQTNHGVFVPRVGGGYHYGLEEWLNHKKLRELKIGYLDCYRTTVRNDGPQNILLYTIDPISRHYYHVGLIQGVSQIHDSVPQINQVKAALGEDWLQNPIDLDFRRLNHTLPGQQPAGTNLYRTHNWNATNIVSTPPDGFIVNIRYQKIDLFDRSEWVDLTKMDPEISNRWKYIRNRFTSPHPAFNTPLTEYLSRNFFDLTS
jgi:hypothetical protein